MTVVGHVAHRAHVTGTALSDDQRGPLFSQFLKAEDLEPNPRHLISLCHESEPPFFFNPATCVGAEAMLLRESDLACSLREHRP